MNSSTISLWFMIFLSFPDVSYHSAEGHSRFGSDVRGDGPHIHKLPEQPGSHPLGKFCLPLPQNPGLLGQRLVPQDLLYPGLGKWKKFQHPHSDTHMSILGIYQCSVVLLKGQFTPKSKIHIFPLACLLSSIMELNGT